MSGYKNWCPRCQMETYPHEIGLRCPCGELFQRRTPHWRQVVKVQPGGTSAELSCGHKVLPFEGMAEGLLTVGRMALCSLCEGGWPVPPKDDADDEADA